MRDTLKIMKRLRLPLTALTAVAVLFVAFAYFHFNTQQHKIVYYRACDGSRQSISDYNQELKDIAAAAGPDGVNPGGPCLGEPVLGNATHRPLLVPSLVILGVVVLGDLVVLYRVRTKYPTKGR